MDKRINYIKFNRHTTVCINCNEVGHTFKYCKKAITSYGILAFKNETSKEKIQFLLIQRKDTIGYIDFLRGKYHSLEYLKILIEEMTAEEHQKIKDNTFDELWDLLWLTKTSKTYKNEYLLAKEKFNQVNIVFLLENTPTKFIDTEYDIPKGRRSNTETIKDCAIREFMEETGYKKNEFRIIDRLNPICEMFLGSNGIWYKHVYFYAKITTTRIPIIGDHPLQTREIKSILWCNFKASINIFRKYDKTKRTTIYKAKTDLLNYYQFLPKSYPKSF
jgi:8-oxo-dGTP pyrophosphatase MutT (NUDIX family)